MGIGVVGALLNGAVALLVSIPVVGYLLAPFARMAVTIPGSISVTSPIRHGGDTAG